MGEYFFDPRSGEAVFVEDNALKTKSTIMSAIGNKSHSEGKAFTAYSKHTIVAPATDEPVFYLENTGNQMMHISKIEIGTNDITLATKFEVHRDTVFVSGGSAVPPVNQNSNSGFVAEAVMLDNRIDDLVFTVDATKEIDDTRIGGGGPLKYPLQFEDAQILMKGKSLSVIAEGAVGTKVRVTAHIYFEDIHNGE